MHPQTTPTFGDMLRETVDLGNGLTVLLLPLVITSVPGILLFIVAPVVLLAAPIVLVAALAVPPYLLYRLARRPRARSARDRT